MEKEAAVPNQAFPPFFLSSSFIVSSERMSAARDISSVQERLEELSSHLSAIRHEVNNISHLACLLSLISLHVQSLSQTPLLSLFFVCYSSEI